MNRTSKTLLSLCAALLLTFGTYACKSSGQSSVNNASPTPTYSGGSAMPTGPTNISASSSGESADSRVGGRQNVQAASADTSYSGTGQTQLTTSGSKSAASNTVRTTSTTTYTTPVVETTPPPVAPNTTEIVTTPAITETPTTTETTTTVTEAPMTSSTQETTTTTTPTETTTTTHRRMHKE